MTEHLPRISIKMHSIESRFVTGPSSILSGGGYVCTFDLGKYSWGTEVIKLTVKPRQAFTMDLYNYVHAFTDLAVYNYSLRSDFDRT